MPRMELSIQPATTTLRHHASSTSLGRDAIASAAAEHDRPSRDDRDDGLVGGGHLSPGDSALATAAAAPQSRDSDVGGAGDDTRR